LIHGGYDVRVNVTDINGNWATGKTHIDSALQTLKKGLSALLDMIVAALKVIAKVASMLLDVIKKIVMRMLKPVLEPIKKMIKNIITKVAYHLSVNSYLMSMFAEDASRSSDDDSKKLLVTITALLTMVFAFSLRLTVIFRILEAIEIGTKPFTAAVSNLASILVDYSKPIILSVILGGLISGTVPLIKEIIDGKKPKDSLSNFLSNVGLTTSAISAAKELYEAVKELRKGGPESKKLGFKLLGLSVAVFGAIITVFSILLPNANQTLLLLLDISGLIISIIGLLLFRKGTKDVKEKIGSRFARLTNTLEKIIAYGSPIAGGIAILAHWAGGEYKKGGS